MQVVYTVVERLHWRAKVLVRSSTPPQILPTTQLLNCIYFIVVKDKTHQLEFDQFIRRILSNSRRREKRKQALQACGICFRLLKAAVSGRNNDRVRNEVKHTVHVDSRMPQCRACDK